MFWVVRASPLSRTEGRYQSVPECAGEKVWQQNIWARDAAALMEAVIFADCVIQFSQSERTLPCIP